MNCESLVILKKVVKSMRLTFVDSHRTSLDTAHKNHYYFRMRTCSARRIRVAFLLILLLCWTQKSTLRAQELTFGGVGAINHSLAGTAVALPRDSAGAMQWNPATISFLDHKQFEFQLGLGRHNAPWYGDEYVIGTVLIGGIVVLVVYAWATSDGDVKSDPGTWNSNQPHITLTPVIIYLDTSDPYYSRPPQQKTPSAQPRETPHESVIRAPNLSYVYRHPGGDWSFGLAISEYGAQKVGALAMGDVIGIGEYRFKGYEFIPTVAYRASQQFSFGLSPIFSLDEMQNATLPVIVSKWGVHSQDQRSKAGFGLQAGAFYSPTKQFRFGASVRTPQIINQYTYRWINPMTGELGSQRLHFSQDSAFRIALGTSYTLKNDNTTFAADFRYSDYSHASALYDIPASFDPAVKKQGVGRAVYTLAFGAEHCIWDNKIAFRMGYQWNHAVSPNKTAIYNTSLPIQSGHSIHYGVTFFFSDIFDLSFSSSNSFGGGQETIQTESGAISFRRNPNRSNFWASARLRF